MIVWLQKTRVGKLVSCSRSRARNCTTDPKRARGGFDYDNRSRQITSSTDLSQFLTKKWPEGNIRNANGADVYSLQPSRHDRLLTWSSSPPKTVIGQGSGGSASQTYVLHNSMSARMAGRSRFISSGSCSASSGVPSYFRNISTNCASESSDDGISSVLVGEHFAEMKRCTGKGLPSLLNWRASSNAIRPPMLCPKKAKRPSISDASASLSASTSGRSLVNGGSARRPPLPGSWIGITASGPGVFCCHVR